MILRLTAFMVALCFAWPAIAKQEPFGQETVEVRPWRYPPRAQTAHRHGHSRRDLHGQAADHVHSAGHEHSHGTLGGHSHPGHGGHRHGLETEHLFGFTVGSDIDEPGVQHVISDLSVRIGKRAGSYTALSHHFEYGFVPWRDFHVGLGASFAGHRISAVPDLSDRRQVEFDGLSLELRQRLLDRAHAPFGLTLVAEPHWARVEEASGDAVDKFALELTLAVDKELIRDRLYGAFNLFYEPEWVHLKSTGESKRESTFGISVAAITPIAPLLYAGGELRYLRKYEGATLNTFAGEALYLGPVVFVNVDHRLMIVAAYSTQVAGRAAGGAGTLDLANFERHRAKFKAVFHF